MGPDDRVHRLWSGGRGRGRLLLPGKQRLSIVATGLGGGGVIANALGTGGIFELNIPGSIVAVLTAVVVIVGAHRAGNRRRT